MLSCEAMTVQRLATGGGTIVQVVKWYRLYSGADGIMLQVAQAVQLKRWYDVTRLL